MLIAHRFKFKRKPGFSLEFKPMKTHLYPYSATAVQKLLRKPETMKETICGTDGFCLHLKADGMIDGESEGGDCDEVICAG